jgi:hypothetical protein
MVWISAYPYCAVYATVLQAVVAVNARPVCGFLNGWASPLRHVRTYCRSSSTDLTGDWNVTIVTG